MKKIIAFFIVVLLVIGVFPQDAWAIYYNRQGEPLLPTGQVETPVIAKIEKLPYGVGLDINSGRRTLETKSYNYIIEKECKALAVNLYFGETLYSCSNGIKFWSDVSTVPFVMAKNRKKKNDEDAAADSAAINSVIMY